jgi:hypothetical protein
VAKSWVNSGEGLEAKLDCTVHADPPAEVLWYQNSFLLQATDRRIMSSKGKTYTLAIKNVQFSDFGNYSCTVVNSIGRDRKYIELSGKPGPARIVSPGYSNPHYYDLRWVVQSVLPVIEVKILYRRVMVIDAVILSLLYRRSVPDQFDHAVRPQGPVARSSREAESKVRPQDQRKDSVFSHHESDT